MPAFPMTAGQITALLFSSAGAGVMNAMAGGGTILTYPTLLFLGESSITANATSTVALWPGAAASMFGYRREVALHREWLKTLFLPSLVGGALGAVLLLKTPARSFERLAPFLILFATVLFMLQGAVARWARKEGSEQEAGAPPSRWVAAWGSWDSPTSTPPTASRTSSPCASTAWRRPTSSRAAPWT